MFEVRAERPGEASAIEGVHTLAFGQPEEARLVRRLRAEGYTIVSMVAAEADEVVGHVLFSRLSVAGIEGVSLAPVSVVPDRQGQGIGSALIVRGLEACRSSAVDVVLVVGEPAYYTRFGFSLATGSQFECPYSGPYLLGLELQPGVLKAGQYAVEYPPPFQDV
jgi:putative acetyltransferase